MDTLYCSCCKQDLPVDSFTSYHQVGKKNQPRRCKNCVQKKNQEWYADNKGHAIAYMTQYRKESKDVVFNHYGGYVCACCGETEKLFLSIDHIHGGGNKHRKAMGMKSGNQFYIWLRLSGYPEGYQVLCYNCNLGKRHNNNVCPHKEKLMKANPLGNLEYELVVNGVTEGSSLKLDGAPGFRIQVPVKDGLAGQDTFKQDAMKTTSRADVEKRRMHIDSGIDIKGVDMFKELGGGTGGSAKEFTSDKSA